MKDQDCTSLINDYDVGLFVKAEDQQALNDGIQRAISKDFSRVKQECPQVCGKLPVNRQNYA